jgi:hypothetical protein
MRCSDMSYRLLLLLRCVVFTLTILQVPYDLSHFVGVITDAVPVAEFMAPDNLQRIVMQAAAKLT